MGTINSTGLYNARDQPILLAAPALPRSNGAAYPPWMSNRPAARSSGATPRRRSFRP